MLKAMTMVVVLLAGAARAENEGSQGGSDAPSVSASPSRSASLMASSNYLRAKKERSAVHVSYAVFGTAAGLGLIGSAVGIGMAFSAGLFSSSDVSRAGGPVFFTSFAILSVSVIALLVTLVVDIASRVSGRHDVLRQRKYEPADPVDAPEVSSASLPTREWSGTGKAVTPMPVPASMIRSATAIPPEMNRAIELAISF